jgi:hypothetical protein
MHITVLLTLLAVTGTDGYVPVGDQHDAAVSTSCDSCGQGGGRISMAAKMQQKRIAKPPTGNIFGMMPQTCYNPPYGCYAPTRFTHRYPAFHGHYYRDPYNYRYYFDYPWHAEMHEPTSLYSYNTERSVPTGTPLPSHAKASTQSAPQTASRSAPVVQPQQRLPVIATPTSAGQRLLRR